MSLTIKCCKFKGFSISKQMTPVVKLTEFIYLHIKAKNTLALTGHKNICSGEQYTALTVS